MKPGFKTTEFAFVVLFMVLNVLAVAAEMLDPKWSALAGSVVLVAYNVARTIAKAQNVEPPKDDKPGLKL